MIKNQQTNDFSSMLTGKPFDILSGLYGSELAAQQLKIEHDAYVEGEARFNKNFERVLSRGEFADHAVAKPLLGDLISATSKRVSDWFGEFAAGVEAAKAAGERTPKRTIAMIKLDSLSHDVIAMLTIKTLVSLMATSSDKHSYMQAIAINIGVIIEEEERYGRIREQEAAHFARHIEKPLKQRAGRHFKVAYMRAVESKMLEAGDLEGVWHSWKKEEHFHVGVKMIELVIEATGMVELKNVKSGNLAEEMATLVLTSRFAKFFTERAFQLAGMSPIFQPCVVPPKPWVSVSGGGYWAEGRRPLAMIRTKTKKALRRYAKVDMPKVYQAVNLAQETPWQVNSKVLDVLNVIAAWDNNPVANMPTMTTLELPELVMDQDDETNKLLLKKWKKSAAAVYRREKARQSRRLSMEFILGQANKFNAFAEIYFPHNLDWRGRAYAIPMFNPQGNDMTKGLLKFSDSMGKPLGKEGIYWLAVHGANCMGFDKANLDARVKYVYDNEEMILSCAMNPLDDTRWADQDSPFCFLAFCFEWLGQHQEGEAYVCSLSTALDGTCSGLQHFSAMLRDLIGGAAVNLTKSAKRNDIYGIIAEKVTEKVLQDVINGSDDEVKFIKDKKSGEEIEKLVLGTKTLAAQWSKHGVTRSVTKRPVMTLAYGAKKFGFADQVLTDTIRPLEDSADNPFTSSGEAARYMAELIWEAVSVTVVAAVEAMEWLQAAAKLLATPIKDGEGVVVKDSLAITWTTPAGFPVWQEYRKFNDKRLRTMFLGIHNLSLTVQIDEKPEMDIAKQTAGVAPNFVHSNDASHLQLTVCHANEKYGIRCFALVHDSFGTIPTDTGKLFNAVRESMVDMYAHNDVIADFYEQFADQLHEDQIDKMPATPSKGNLDIQEILQSEFAFS